MSVPTPGQQALIDRLSEVLGADARVDGAWLSGSFGTGHADAWSDVDVIAVVDEEDLGACLAEYSGPRNPVGEMVLLRPIFGRIVTAVAPNCERYDIVFLTAKEFRGYDKARLKPLAKGPPPDRPPVDPPRSAPDQAQMLAMAHEFLRINALAPVAVGREEWIVALEGVGLLRKLTVDLMLEANGLGAASRGGAKRLNGFLQPEQRTALEALPPVAPTREGIVGANLALAALFLPLGRRLLGEAWPQALEDATRAHLQRTLGVTL